MVYAASRPGSYISPISLSGGLEEYGEPDEITEAQMQAEIQQSFDAMYRHRTLTDERADYDIEADRRERDGLPAYDDSGLPF